MNEFQLICLTPNFLKLFYSVCFTKNPPNENTSCFARIAPGKKKKKKQKLLKEIHLNLFSVIDSLNI